MKSKLIIFLVVLFLIIVLVGIVAKLVRWAISLAVILGIGAIIFYFVTKKK